MKMIPPLNPEVEFEGSLLPWIERSTDMCMPSGIQDLAYQIAWSIVGICVIFLVFLFIIFLTYVLFTIIEGLEKLYQLTKDRGGLNRQRRPITDLERSRLQGAWKVINTCLLDNTMVCTKYHTLKYQTWIYWLLLAIFCLTGTIQTILRIYFFEEFEARLCRRVFSYEKCLFLKGFYERWKWCKLATNKWTRQYLLGDIFDQHHGLCKKNQTWLLLAVFCVSGTQTIPRIYFFKEYEARLCRRVFSDEKCLFAKGCHDGSRG